MTMTSFWAVISRRSSGLSLQSRKNCSGLSPTDSTLSTILPVFRSSSVSGTFAIRSEVEQLCYRLHDDKTTQPADNALALAIANGPPVVLAMRRDSVNGVELWRQPLDRFAQKDVRLGHVHADPDFDGIIRRVFSAKTGEGRVVPAFAFQTLHAAGLPFKSDFELKQGAVTVIRPEPVNIRFVGDEHSFPHVPAWKILDGSA